MSINSVSDSSWDCLIQQEFLLFGTLKSFESKWSLNFLKRLNFFEKTWTVVLSYEVRIEDSRETNKLNFLSIFKITNRQSSCVPK